MKQKLKITKTQWCTIALIILYLLWEFVFLASWKANTTGPLIRIDLIFIYPLIILALAISLWQFFKEIKL